MNEVPHPGFLKTQRRRAAAREQASTRRSTQGGCSGAACKFSRAACRLVKHDRVVDDAASQIRLEVRSRCLGHALLVAHSNL